MYICREGKKKTLFSTEKKSRVVRPKLNLPLEDSVKVFFFVCVIHCAYFNAVN